MTQKCTKCKWFLPNSFCGNPKNTSIGSDCFELEENLSSSTDKTTIIDNNFEMNNIFNTNILDILRKETGLGYAKLKESLMTFIDALKQKPMHKMDIKTKLTFNWIEQDMRKQEETVVYQLEFSKGSYDSFVTWCSDELYASKELAEKALKKFKEENSIDNLWKKMKLSKKEDWRDEYELPSIYTTKDHQSVAERLNMTIDEFNKACGDDVFLFYEYLCEGEGYNYDQFDIVERKIILK